jgi:hypothetical protein
MISAGYSSEGVLALKLDHLRGGRFIAKSWVLIFNGQCAIAGQENNAYRDGAR